MSKRDKQIIGDLKRFRCMSRDDIAELYFSGLKSPINSANAVLKRLTRDNKIRVSRSFRPFVYFPFDSTMKKNSTKIPHFLSIVQIYKDVKQYNKPDIFLVEPKYKKGLAEPDVYTTIKGVSFFVEMQRNEYDQKVMDDKMKRYEALYYSNIIAKEKFPFVIMITDTRYEIKSDLIKVFQVSSIQEFIENVSKQPQQERKTYNSGIKIALS